MKIAVEWPQASMAAMLSERTDHVAMMIEWFHLPKDTRTRRIRNNQENLKTPLKIKTGGGSLSEIKVDKSLVPLSVDFKKTILATLNSSFLRTPCPKACTPKIQKT